MFAAFGSAVSLIEAATTASQTKKPSATADSPAALFELPQDAASDLGVSQPAGTTMQTSSLSPETLGQVFQSQSESRRQMGMPVQPDPDDNTSTGERSSQPPQTFGNAPHAAPGIQIVDTIGDPPHSAPGVQIVDTIGDPTSTFSQLNVATAQQAQSATVAGLSSLAIQTYAGQASFRRAELPLLTL